MSASDSMYNVCIFMSSTERVGIDLDGRRYFLASEAAADFGFSPDHIARLARQGKINGRRVGKKWYVEPESLQTYLKVLGGPPRPASLSSEVPEHTSAERIAHHMHTRGRHTMRDWSPPNEASERRQSVSPVFPLASLALAIILSTAAAYAAFNPTGASTIASRVQSQFAAASADTSIFDRAAQFLFRTVCPIFRSCDPNDVRIADAGGADHKISLQLRCRDRRRQQFRPPRQAHRKQLRLRLRQLHPPQAPRQTHPSCSASSNGSWSAHSPHI